MAQTAEAIAQTLEHFIRSQFRIPAADARFNRGVHLYEVGFVDSAGFAELIAFLDSYYELELLDEDILSDEFTTIDGISSVVHRRLNATPSLAASAAPSPASHDPE